MAEMKDFAGKRLEWQRKGLMQRGWELRGGGEVLATLNWLKIMGTLAEATAEGTAYTIKRSGFLHPYVTVRRAPFDEDVARMDLSFGGNGTLQFPDGKRYSFQKMSFWGYKWTFTDESGNVILNVGQQSAFKNTGEVFIEAGGAGDRHLPLLVILAWYMAVQIMEENTVAAASAAGI